MSRTSTKAALAALVAIPLLGAPSSFAQDAMMLEQIGAVRMVTPAELQRRDNGSVQTLWFADARTTAYYTLDQARHEVVARLEAGPKGGHPSVVRRTLEDRAVERISVDGTGRNRIRATLVVSRTGDTLSATVQTSVERDQASAGQHASSTTPPAFYLPAVVGAAFTDRRIATNPDEVRRQGGFATPEAVRWLPAATKATDNPSS